MSKRPKLTVSPFDLLLPYQQNWVNDRSRFKIWLKSRQIGGSLAAAFEIVADALETGGDWVILSAGERQALEFMAKVHQAAAVFCDAIAYETNQAYQPETKASQCRFPNGARLIALPANASTARGYSANLVLDEFAFHEKPEEIWRAVYPIISNPLRGNLKLRVLSTPAGMNNKYFDLWENGADFARHKTTVYDAFDAGLKINIEELRANLNDPDGWSQEFECQFMAESAQVFPRDTITAAEDPAASHDWDTLTRNPVYVGVDIGRKKDLTVCWTLEAVNGILWTREILVLDNVSFPDQEAALTPRLQRATYSAIDATGIGGPVSEHLSETLGDYKLDAVTFTAETKRELFVRTKKHFQEASLKIPPDPRLRDDLASLQRVVSPSGNVRYTAARSADGHADRSTALALALHAAANHGGRGITFTEKAIRMGGNPTRFSPTQTRFRSIHGGGDSTLHSRLSISQSR